MGKGIRKSFCLSFCLGMLAFLTVFFVAGQKEVQAGTATSGIWGDCTWEITDEGSEKVLTVLGKTDGANGGDRFSAPWKLSSGVDITGVTKIVVGDKGKAVTLTEAQYLFSGVEVKTIEMKSVKTEVPNQTASLSMESMFRDNDTSPKLESLDLSGLDTSGVTNMKSMFTSCKALKTLTLPETFNTSNVENMSNMFASCTALKTLALPETFNTSSVTDMSGMFSTCSALTTLTLPETFNTNNVENMSYMFFNCTALTTLTLPAAFNTGKVTDMLAMFSGCKALTTLTLPAAFKTSKVTDMSNMFNDCSVLTTLELPKAFDTSKVTDMRYMFDGCSALTTLTLSETFDTSEVTAMSSMFNGCSALTTLTLPEKFNTSKVTDMGGMFYGCSALTTLTLPEKFNTSSKTNMDSMFYDCPSLKNIPSTLILPPKARKSNMFGFSTENKPTSPVVTTYSGSDAGMIGYDWAGDNRQLDITSLADGTTGASVKLQVNGTDVNGSVQKGTVLEYVLEPEKIKEAFSGKDINIKTLTTTWQRKAAGASKFENIDGASGPEYTVTAEDAGAMLRVVLKGSDNLCGELASSEVQAEIATSGTWGECTWEITDDGSEKVLTVLGKTDGAEAGTVDSAPWKSAGGADMTGVTKIVVGDQEKAVTLTEAENLFTGLKVQTIEMKSVKTKVPDQTASLSMMNMFWNCKSLERLELSGLDAGGVTNMTAMFNGCNVLTTLTLSETFNTSNVTSMHAMFNGCNALTTLTLPESFNVSNVTNMESMFSGCNALMTLTLPETFDTSRVRNMGMMFNSCSALTTLTLPDAFDTSKVVTMNNMFSGCKALTTLTLPDVFDISEVEDMFRMFYDCPALKNIPSTLILPPKANKSFMFGFSDDNKPDPSLTTTYAGSDAEMISYDWAGDNRRLDIASLADGSNKASVKLQVNGADVKGPVQKGTVLKYVLGPEKIKKALSGEDIKPLSVTWQRKTAGASAFVNIEGASGAEYTVTAEDVGAELRVVLTGNDNLCGELPSSVAQISKMTPAADDFAVTLPGTGTEHTKEYDGGQTAASVSASEGITGLGDITVWYARLKDNGNYDTAVKDAPKDAGTYRVTYTAAEGSKYLGTEMPLEAGTFTITPRTLSADVGVAADALSTTVDVKEAEGVTVPLEGGNIISGDKVSATGCSVTYPSASEVGDHTDGTVTAGGLNNLNYALPENGLILSNQAYSVEARTLTGLEVTSAPAKTSYIEGETFDPEGMIIQASYDNGSTKDVTGFVTWTPVGALTPSYTAVTVSYKEGNVTQTANITISVSARSYTIAALPETLDFGTVQENYEEPGEQTVTISNTGNQTVQLTLTGNENFDSRLSASTLAVGESVTLTVSPNAGLDKGTYDTKLTVSTDHETAVEVAVAFTVREPEPVVYPVLSVGPDNSGAWTKGEGSLPIRIDAVFSLFAHQVMVDKISLEEGVDYRAESGSTVIILEQKYLDTLEAGKHTMRAAFENGYSETEFEIKGTSSPAGEEKPQGDAQKPAGTDGSKKAAATGDNVAPGVYAALLVMAGAALIGAGAVRRRRKMREQER